MPPETRYAKSGAVQIAYQVFGEGDFDLVYVPGFISNLDLYWEHPTLARFLARLGAFCRVIMFDKRGTGLSDRTGTVPMLEERMDDVRAVMDSAKSDRAAVFGISEGGAMSMLFAATYPDRTQALALFGTYPDFFSYVVPPEEFESRILRLADNWGTGATLDAFAPTMAADPASRQWWARFERLSASPSAALSLMRMNSEINVRHVLPLIRTPTLVLHRIDDTRVNANAARYLAASISGARYVELPGRDHLLWSGDADRVADEMELFLTGSRADLEPDRILATVMFTDIVDSTKHAASLGDRRWRELLDQHDLVLRREIGRFRGREVKSLGDGFLATFDGPARAVRCGRNIIDAVRPLGLQVRAGVHAGEIKVKGSDIGGIAVHIAARVAALASSNQILVSRTVRDLVAGSDLRFSDLGPHALKGLDEPIRLFLAEASGS